MVTIMNKTFHWFRQKQYILIFWLASQNDLANVIYASVYNAEYICQTKTKNNYPNSTYSVSKREINKVPETRWTCHHLNQS